MTTTRRRKRGEKPPKHHFIRIPANSLSPHPLNWRTHPEPQRLALEFMLESLGNVDVLKVVPNQDGDGYMLLDGHLRADIMGDHDVDVMVLDLDEEQQRQFLLFYDPITMMANRDKELTNEIVEALTLSDEHMQALAATINSRVLAPLQIASSDVSVPDGQTVSFQVSDDMVVTIRATKETWAVIAPRILALKDEYDDITLDVS